MSTQDWSRVGKTKRIKGDVDANSIPIGVVVAHFGGEVREGRNVSVRCCIHNDTRRSAVIDTYNNWYFCHTCGKGGNAVNIISVLENLEFKDALTRAVEITTGSGHSLQQVSQRRGRKVSRRTWDI